MCYCSVSISIRRPSLRYFFILFHIFSFAYARADVDLSGRFGPIKEQGQTQYCQAAVAADLLDEFFGHNNDSRISFLDIALHISVKNDGTQSFLDTYVTDRHPDNSQVMWTMDGKAYEYAEAYPFGGRQNIYERTNYTSWAIYSYTNLNLKGQCKESDLPSEDESQNVLFLPNMIDSLKQKIKPEISSSDKNESVNQQVAKEIFQSCQRSVIPSVVPKSINLMDHSPSQKVNELVQLLDQGIPSGLSFNFMAVHPQADFLHVSTLVGYSNDGGKLAFKLRNSFGKKCRADMFPVPKCKDGYLYIDASDLIPYASYITWIPR